MSGLLNLYQWLDTCYAAVPKPEIYYSVIRAGIKWFLLNAIIDVRTFCVWKQKQLFKRVYLPPSEIVKQKFIFYYSTRSISEEKEFGVDRSNQTTIGQKSICQMTVRQKKLKDVLPVKGRILDCFLWYVRVSWIANGATP